MRFSVPDMSCGHCKAAVERAIAEKDATASVTVDLSARQVVVETALAAADVIATLAAEGYPAEVLN
ncbi:MAG: heavy-metal-associated domain-containing protein [Rhodobacteraceae bacterium]|nr:heavy-metal-associated domain-containing protein [Paracoccaceae bacterium]MCB2138342.1 heavy-metal-associated domain-containing protein [Paracoccaceae bacterium]MCO5126226.1 heavy-metal-associated domain-containing protein [Paracoccaceae bacterium]